MSVNTPCPDAPCTILLIDDDPDLRETLADGLEAAGHRVFQASAVGNLLRELPRMEVSVVILDLILAGGSGAVLLAYIKKHPQLQHIQVILISGAAHGRRTAHDWDADSFLQKPFTIADLQKSIRTVLMGHAETQRLK